MSPFKDKKVTIPVTPVVPIPVVKLNFLDFTESFCQNLNENMQKLGSPSTF